MVGLFGEIQAEEQPRLAPAAIAFRLAGPLCLFVSGLAVAKEDSAMGRPRRSVRGWARTARNETRKNRAQAMSAANQRLNNCCIKVDEERLNRLARATTAKRQTRQSLPAEPQTRAKGLRLRSHSLR